MYYIIYMNYYIILFTIIIIIILILIYSYLKHSNHKIIFLDIEKEIEQKIHFNKNNLNNKVNLRNLNNKDNLRNLNNLNNLNNPINYNNTTDNFNDLKKCQVPTLNTEQCYKSREYECPIVNGTYLQCTNNYIPKPKEYNADCGNRTFDMVPAPWKISENCYYDKIGFNREKKFNKVKFV